MRTHQYLPDREGSGCWCHFLLLQNIPKRPAVWLKGASTTRRQRTMKFCRNVRFRIKTASSLPGCPETRSKPLALSVSGGRVDGVHVESQVERMLLPHHVLCTTGGDRPCSRFQSPCTSNEVLQICIPRMLCISQPTSVSQVYKMIFYIC